MNLGKKLAAAAAIAFSVAAAPAMAKADLMHPQICNGSEFTGEYIVEPNPSKKALTVAEFNNAAGENIVGEIDIMQYGTMVMTPVYPASDCNVFMKKIQDTNLVRWIAPNSIMRIQ